MWLYISVAISENFFKRAKKNFKPLIGDTLFKDKNLFLGFYSYVLKLLLNNIIKTSNCLVFTVTSDKEM